MSPGHQSQALYQYFSCGLHVPATVIALWLLHGEGGAQGTHLACLQLSCLVGRVGFELLTYPGCGLVSGLGFRLAAV